MSMLHKLPIAEFRKKYGLSAFVETGTGGGGAIQLALDAGFETVLSCEIIWPIFEEAFKKFYGCNQVRLWWGPSVEKLPKMLREITNRKALFWLDAHLPRKYGRGIFVEEEILPLREELAILRRQRDCSKDVILIDDLPLFDPAARAECGTVEDYSLGDMRRDVPTTVIEFMFPSHRVYVDSRNDRVLILAPHDKTGEDI